MLLVVALQVGDLVVRGPDWTWGNQVGLAYQCVFEMQSLTSRI